MKGNPASGVTHCHEPPKFPTGSVVTLTITNAAKRVVRTFTSVDDTHQFQ